ncbi:MAG: SWIM zinc finger family protein, partial [Rubrobacter sp.]|nr:SWIM zinc finger family protein [Rubrobacter sp.]
MDKSLTHDALVGLAGKRYFERGEGYHRGGHVYSLVEHDGVIVAKVAGTEEYRVSLWAEDGLAYSCDCPLGMDGAFCKHCVAVGLAWLEEGGEVSEEPVTMDDVREYLEGREKDELVGIVMEQAMEDERLRERLLL